MGYKVDADDNDDDVFRIYSSAQAVYGLCDYSSHASHIHNYMLVMLQVLGEKCDKWK